MRRATAEDIRKIIFEKIPLESITTAHNTEGHFYQRPGLEKPYPSVNGKINIIKEKGLMDWKMNKALDYIFQNINIITPENQMEIRDNAEMASVVELEEAGDIGTEIHNYRETIFKDWIRLGYRPKDFISYIPKDEEDIRSVSAIGALEKFCKDYFYQPIVTEQYVYDDTLQLGGTLDDVGFIYLPVRPGTHGCDHDIIGDSCIKCELKLKRYLALIDLKTSNYFKNTYWIQVALYYHMFCRLTGLKLPIQMILKLDKYNRTYKIERLKEIGNLVKISKDILKVSDGMELVTRLREKEFITI